MAWRCFSPAEIEARTTSRIQEDRMRGLTWWCNAGSLESPGNVGATSVEDDDVEFALDALLLNLHIPNVDNKSVTTHLDAKIGAIANAVTALNRASFARILPLRRKRNSQMPINRLPAEVLNEILARVVEREESYTPVINLMKVCKQWHDFIMDTPTFWNYISEGYNSVVSTLLERSKSTPLRLRCKENRWDGSLTPIAFGMGPNYIQRFLTETCHHFSRWEDVELDLDSIGESFLENPAPVLRNFDLRLRRSGSTEPNINLFNGHAPQLESLSISGWSLPWASPVFNRLITLRISRVEANPPSVGDLILMLQASPVLSEFQLSQTAIVAADRDSLRCPVKVTTLSHLHTWSTTEVDSNTMGLLLEHFEMPVVSTVRLGLPVGAEWDNMPAPGSSIQGLFESVLQEQGDLGLEVGRARFQLWKKDGMRLSLSVTRESAETYLSWLMVCYGSSLTDRITSFTCNGEAIDCDTVIRMLPNMESLEVLRLDSYGNLDVVLEYLKRPSFSSSAGVWPLPRLRSFYLDGCGWSSRPNALLGALQWRYGIELKNIVGLNIILPDRLTSLRIDDRGIPSDDYNDILPLVGYEHCELLSTWRGGRTPTYMGYMVNSDGE